jgi:hypothetical protein
MTPVSPDISQGIVTTIYNTFSHNSEAFAYFVGMCIGIGLMIRKPSRFATFVMLGFALLLFGFEYDKHIIIGLRDQTLTSLATARPHLRFNRIVSIFISELLPIIFYAAGWVLVFLSIIVASLKMHKKGES